MSAVAKRMTKKIIVRAPNWLGDCVMALPALRALKKTFGGDTLAVEARRGVAPLFELCGEADMILTCPDGGGYKNFGPKLKHSHVVSEMEFDLGVLLTNSLSTAFWMWQSHVEHCVGTDASGRGIFLDGKVSYDEEFKKQHMIDWYLKIMEEAGADISEADRIPHLHKASAEEIKAAFSAAGYKAPSRYAILAPGSAYGPAKDWPSENFAAIARMLNKKMQYPVVITGSPKDREAAEKIAAACGPGAVSIAGKTDLRQFLAILSGAAGFVGNDSGASHCAAAFGVATIVVFGSTRPERTSPTGKCVTCLTGSAPCAPCMRRTCNNRRNPYQCLYDVTPENVWNAMFKNRPLLGSGNYRDSSL